MADITMCDNKECKNAHKCYRFKAIPDPYWQSFCTFKEKNCKMFIPIEKRKK